jgi:hypothetical protein
LRRARHRRPQLTAELDTPHVHAKALVGGWTTLRALLKIYRQKPGDFPAAPYLRADPRRIAHWKRWLTALGPGLKVGVRWRTDSANCQPWRHTPPLAALQEALSQPGLHVVPLQKPEAPAAPGPTLHPPPGLDFSDLDEVAALSGALDLVVGAPDPATYVAAASGAQTWLLAPPRHWALLGQAAYPWFPKAKVFTSAAFNDWEAAAAALSAALTTALAERT